MKYLLIDLSNMYYRARYTAHRASDSWTKLGVALNVTIMSANKVARDLGADHVVFALDGSSWRKDHYKPYKANRAVARGAMTEAEAEEDKMFWETYETLTKYLSVDYHRWSLFLKCVRGDPGDNVFSAYPGAPVKGSKNRVGITEAYGDRDKKGYSWNNFMLQKWVDHEDKEHRVLDAYERNRELIDLTAQPAQIKDAVDTAIHEQVSHKDIGMVGAHFLKFCGKYELTKLSDSADAIGRWLNKTYQGVLNDHSKTSST